MAAPPLGELPARVGWAVLRPPVVAVPAVPPASCFEPPPHAENPPTANPTHATQAATRFAIFHPERIDWARLRATSNDVLRYASARVGRHGDEWKLGQRVLECDTVRVASRPHLSHRLRMERRHAVADCRTGPEATSASGRLRWHQLGWGVLLLFLAGCGPTPAEISCAVCWTIPAVVALCWLVLTVLASAWREREERVRVHHRMGASVLAASLLGPLAAIISPERDECLRFAGPVLAAFGALFLFVVPLVWRALVKHHGGGATWVLVVVPGLLLPAAISALAGSAGDAFGEVYMMVGLLMLVGLVEYALWLPLGLLLLALYLEPALRSRRS